MQAAELEGLWAHFCTTRSPAMRERLIVQYAPLVQYVVRRLAVRVPGVLDSDDLMSDGTIGLIQAVDRYDPSVGVKFEIYALRRIRGAIIDAVRSLQRLPRGASQCLRHLDHVFDELAQLWGRVPTNRELADHLGLRADDIAQVLLDSSLRILSLDATYREELDEAPRSLLERIAAEADPDIDAQIERRQLCEALVHAIQGLSARDRHVVTLYYSEERTLREISEILGISTSRMSQLHRAVLFRLRATLRADTPRAAAA